MPRDVIGQSNIPQILSRELLLKLNVKSINELPRLRRLNLAIQAKDVAGGPFVSATGPARFQGGQAAVFSPHA
jgi:hypothetical protein